MSLSSWLKDYVYIPLGGNRRGISRKYINLLLTFLVSGVWHGAGFSFIFWGLLHALYQIIESMTESIRSKIKKIIGIKTGSISEKIYQIVITFHLVTFAWIFFRAIGFRVGLEYVQHMLSSANLWALFDGSLFTYGVSQNYFILILIHIIVLIFIEWQYSRQEHVVNNILQLHIGIRWIIYLVLLFDVLLFGVYGSGYSLSSFMYGGF